MKTFYRYLAYWGLAIGVCVLLQGLQRHFFHSLDFLSMMNGILMVEICHGLYGVLLKRST